MALSKIEADSLATTAITSNALPAGSVIATYQALNTAPSTIVGTSNGYTTVTGLTVTLTPQSVNSKFLISARVYGEAGDSDGHSWSMALFDGSSHINSGDGQGSRGRVISTSGADHSSANISSTPQTWNATTLYTPSTTDEITIAVTMSNQGNTATFYLNKTVGDSDAMSSERGSSELVIMEIAG